MSFALLLYIMFLDQVSATLIFVLFCFCGRFVLSSFKLCCFMLVVLLSNKKTTLISSPTFRFMTPHFIANPPGAYFKNKENAFDRYRNIQQKHSVSPYLDLYGFHRTLKLHPHRKRLWRLVKWTVPELIGIIVKKDTKYRERKRYVCMSVLVVFFC